MGSHGGPPWCHKEELFRKMQHNVLLKIPLFDDMMLNLFDWRVGVVSVPVHRASAPHWLSLSASWEPLCVSPKLPEVNTIYRGFKGKSQVAFPWYQQCKTLVCRQSEVSIFSNSTKVITRFPISFQAKYTVSDQSSPIGTGIFLEWSDTVWLPYAGLPISYFRHTYI